MPARSTSTDAKQTVVRKLRHMGLVDRMRLLKKYTRVIDHCYRQSDLQQRQTIVLTIHRLKFNRQDLIDFYLSREPVLDQRDCRLYEFLEAELQH